MMREIVLRCKGINIVHKGKRLSYVKTQSQRQIYRYKQIDSVADDSMQLRKNMEIF